MRLKFSIFLCCILLLLTGCSKQQSDISDKNNDAWEIDTSDSNALFVLLSTALSANDEYSNIHFVLRLTIKDAQYDYELDEIRDMHAYRNHEVTFTAYDLGHKIKTTNGVAYIYDMDDTLLNLGVPYTISIADARGDFETVIISTTQPLNLTAQLN